MADVKVPISITVQAESKIQDLAKDLAALSKIRAGAGPGGQDESAKLKRYSDGLKDVTKQFNTADDAAFSLASKIGDLGKTAVSGAGLGRYAALLGAGGATAFVGAAAGIAAQAARMQYTFLETTTRAAATLSIGSRDFARNVGSFQEASKAGIAYGIAPNQMASALANYTAGSGASGADLFSSSAALAKYSRASGVDVNTLAGATASITQFAGGSGAKQVLTEAFDAAVNAGALGRRIIDFISTSQSAIQGILMTNPGMSAAAATELGFRRTANIAAMGGIYATPQGNQALQGSLASLGSGALGDPNKAGLALASGVSTIDLLLGRDPVGQGAKIARLIGRLTPGNPTLRAAMLAGNPLAYDYATRGGNIDAPLKKKFDASGRAAEVGDTQYGQISGDFAQLAATMNHLGDIEMNALVPALNGVTDAVTALTGTPGTRGGSSIWSLGSKASGPGGTMTADDWAADTSVKNQRWASMGASVMNGLAYMSLYGSASDDAKKDLAAKSIQQNLFDALAATNRSYKLGIGTLVTGHTKDVMENGRDTGRLSDHYRGLAADITSINGLSASGFNAGQKENGIFRDFLRDSIMSGAYQQIGLPHGSSYLSDMMLQRLAKKNNVSLFEETDSGANGSVHLAARQGVNVGGRKLEITVRDAGPSRTSPRTTNKVTAS